MPLDQRKIHLADWRDDGGMTFDDITAPIPLALTIQSNRIDIESMQDGDSRAVMIELEGGTLRIHGYQTENDEPIDIDLTAPANAGQPDAS